MGGKHIQSWYYNNLKQWPVELSHLELKAKEDRVQDLKVWKEKMDDIASPPQLKSAFDDIEELKTFKTKSIAIFMAVQTMMGIAMAWSKMF